MDLPTEAARLDGDWQEVYSALQWIQFTVAMLSVVGSSSIIAYAVFQNTVRSPEGVSKTLQAELNRSEETTASDTQRISSGVSTS